MNNQSQQTQSISVQSGEGQSINQTSLRGGDGYLADDYMKEKCENCGAFMIYDIILHNWVCLICGWTPSLKPVEDKPNYV